MSKVLSVGVVLVLSGLSEQTALIRQGSVGPVSLGMSVAALESAIPAGARRRVDLKLEGMATPAVEISLPKSSKAGGVIAELNGDRVERIWITDSMCRTDSGIGVGSTMAELRRAYRITWVGFGEGRLYARVEQLGASFELDLSGPRGPRLERITDAAKVPDDVKIVGVLLTRAA